MTNLVFHLFALFCVLGLTYGWVRSREALFFLRTGLLSSEKTVVFSSPKEYLKRFAQGLEIPYEEENPGPSIQTKLAPRILWDFCRLYPLQKIVYGATDLTLYLKGPDIPKDSWMQDLEASLKTPIRIELL
jgi:hypothetical protein